MIKVIFRFIRILFKLNRKLQKVEFNYSDKYLFENGYMLINFEFKNALYYTFNGKVEINSGYKIYNISRINKTISFKVFGFFQSEEYLIQCNPNNVLYSNSFKTQINHLKFNMNERKLIVLDHPKIYRINTQIEFLQKEVSIQSKNIEVQLTKFNQTEFI